MKIVPQDALIITYNQAKTIAQQASMIELLSEKNQQMAAEIEDLKSRLPKETEKKEEVQS